MKMKSVWGFREMLSERIADFIDEREKLNIYQNILRKASYAGSPFLKYFFGRSINRVMILLLQLISLCTTLVGANYYLRGINPTAPILFAVTIQLGVYYYANSYVDMEGRKYSHAFLLVLLTSISILFSYTGLAVVCCPPEYEYARTYENYKKKSEAVITALLDANSTQQDIEQDVIRFFGDMNTGLTTADAQIAALTQAIAADQSIIDESKRGTSTRTYDPRTGKSTTTTTVSDDGIAARQDQIVKTQQKGRIESARQTLYNAIQNISVDNLKKYVKDELPDASRNDVAANAASLIGSYNALNQLLETNLSIESDYIDQLCDQYKTGSMIADITLPAYSDESTSPVDDISNWKSFLNRLLMQDSSAETALETLSQMKKDVDKNYTELGEYAGLLGAHNSVLSDLEQAKAEMDRYGDPNVQVIQYLLNDQYRGKVLGSFFLAILVDGLTLLLGILGNKRRLSLLDPSTNKELIDNEEQLFAIIFLSLVGTSVPQQLRTVSRSDFKASCIAYVNEIKDIIRDFLSHFKNSPWTGQWGYGLYAEYSELVRTDGAVPIISILHQLGYLQFLSKSDFQLLQKNFDGLDINAGAPNRFSDTGQATELNGYICILRYRVEMYLHNNIAEISTMFIDDAFNDELLKEDLA